MLNFAARDFPLRVGCVQAGALGEEMFERAWLRAEDFSCRTIAHPQSCAWGAAMGALAGVFSPIVARLAAHSRVEIWKMKPGACDADCDCVGRIKAEKPDAGLSAVGDVGAHIEFGECGDCW